MSAVERFRGKSFSFLKLGALFVATAVYIFVGSVPVSAASNSLGVTPRKDYTINPGGSISDTLYIDNLSKNSALTVSMRVVDFTAQGQTGSPSLLIAPNAPQEPYSLKPYLSLPSTVTIQPLASDYVPVSIKIPKNLGAGSHYSAVLYSANISGTAQQVTIAASAATLIFVTVPGKASELLNLVKYGAYVPATNNSAGSFKSLYISSQPQELAYVLNNQGNVAEDPSGSIVIKNEYGKVVTNISQANPNQNLALIGQTRLFETCIKTGQKQVTGGDGQVTIVQQCVSPNLSPGRYTAFLETLYGINGNTSQEITATTTFWYLPVWFMAVIAAIIVVIVAIIWIVIHILRKRQKHKKHSHHQSELGNK